MHINIKSKDLDLTPALKVFIEKKLEAISKLVSKWEKMGAVSVDFEVARTTKHHYKGNVFYAEANLIIGKSEVIRAETSSEDVREAINTVKNMLKEKVIKYKDTHE